MPVGSRGCAACRQRRIGCDGGLPACRQCIITHRKCSGPLQGLIFIDQTSKVQKKASKGKKGPQSTPLIRQPSAIAIYALNFTSGFLSFIMARNEPAYKGSWLAEVRCISNVDETAPALDLAMQATALAYCGFECNNPSAARYACEIYGSALSKHSKSLREREPTVGNICTCMMLSLFEAIQATNLSAYGTHLRAAQKMLLHSNLHGPYGFMFGHLAGHIQCQMLFVMISTPNDHLRAVAEDDELAEAIQSKYGEPQNAIDSLLPHLLKLTNLLVRPLSPSKPLFSTQHVESPREISILWYNFRQQATAFPEKSGWQFQDAFTALAVAYFASTDILRLVLGMQGVTSSSMEVACDFILQSCLCTEGNDMGCAYLRMFFPLTLVALYSPNLKQREVAQNKFLVCWLQRTAFVGMGSVALGRIRAATLRVTSGGD